ncbi:nitrogenase iron-molybdenum cofactor biosynthesis protein NifE [Sporomusa sphaeroides]|uniref:Nitrogenase iron-molybdenum cofactor biosynthesis protein NifE n=2 Tax=Sporomusa TaxID=2375 RepID=A0ABP2C8H4_9FIRM|nr:nitrogenase iron-molybdenum cofactor biosynthesis protein NifE [Sporomusa sphaeroides]OLS55981.1 nitrogenase molybdenum-iron protein alpha chain [Sporomusa sphaeroides DSM 2875]CVK20192.1 Nitrogenase molybdenum-iron protein alpha chain [Sporomusa sphaeroides DSM 2875]SCM82776.1 Nitrogenase iron-molybdenum cofactor biosynthesis protein NifE [uncultured Sporomusa sp.]
MNETAAAINEREDFIATKGRRKNTLKCDADSIAGCISQRACVYCGARVVLNPVTDAIHLVHGPVGCASYTWDIRGSLSSGSELYRNSFSTDLREQDIIFGGEKKLAGTIDDLVAKYRAKLVFVYSTCIVGVIGDDLAAVCKAAADRHNIEVIPVESSGFIGNKSAGYRAACEALLKIIDPVDRHDAAASFAINYLGDFNLAGEAWIIKDYLARMGIKVNAVFTGDSTSATIKQAARVSLNIVQCAGSMNYLAGKLQELYGIPYRQVSFLGVEDTARSLRSIADAMGGGEVRAKAEVLIRQETDRVMPVIKQYREKLAGKKAAVYVGGGFKAISLIKQFREIGIEVVMVGTQTGRQEEYDTIHELVTDGTVILDDANPAELERFMTGQGAHLLVGGVKERPLAYKLGLAFIDHNHDRKHPLSGYDGAINFAREVYSTVCSPVWKYTVQKGGV